jgi:hypothetical protein
LDWVTGETGSTAPSLSVADAVRFLIESLFPFLLGECFRAATGAKKLELLRTFLCWKKNPGFKVKRQWSMF